MAFVEVTENKNRKDGKIVMHCSFVLSIDIKTEE